MTAVGPLLPARQTVEDSSADLKGLPRNTYPLRGP